MCISFVLALLEFSKEFSLETDASSRGIGAILSQNGRPLAYLSKTLGPRHTDLSIYEKEYITILMEVTKWRHYLEGRPFVIKTDHEPLKQLLEQRKTTMIQKQGLTNSSYIDNSKLNTITTTLITPSWVHDIEDNYKDDAWATSAIPQLTLSPTTIQNWEFSKGVLHYKSQIYILESRDNYDSKSSIHSLIRLKEATLAFKGLINASNNIFIGWA
ncbi:hypothetical protein GQ457_07G010380 [Hibiscus cannabinus]